MTINSPVSGVNGPLSALFAENINTATPKTVAALVLESLRLSPANAQDLLARNVLPDKLQQQLAESLQQFNSNRLSAQLLQTHLPTLLKLQLPPAATRSPAWVLSEIPVPVGKTLALQMLNGELQLKSREATSLQTKQNQQANPQTRAAEISQLLRKSEPLITDTLRSVLPRQDHTLSLLRSLKTPETTLQLSRMLPISAKGPLTNTLLNTFDAVKTWIDARPDVKNLSPQTLVEALQKSGAFLEKNLLISKLGPQPPSTPSRGNIGIAALEGSELIKADTKALLLIIMDMMQSLRSPQASKLIGDKAVDALIRMFIKQIAPRFDADSANPKQELTKLEQLLTASLSKINANQLQNLSNNRTDTAFNHWFASDIVLRQDDYLFPVNLYFKQHTRDKEQKEKQRGKARHWTLFLQWELPESGRFHAEVIFKDQHLGGKIWIENDDIKRQFKNKLGKLKERFAEKNIQLERFDCIEQPLRAPVLNNSSQIIDVNT